MLSPLHRRITIPISVLYSAVQQDKIDLESKEAVLKSNLSEYYNTKLLYFMRYEKWAEFFYVYETAKILNHGSNDATFVIAAHGLVMAYQNISKAKETLDSVQDGPAKRLCLNIFDTYLELKSLDLQPASPDWISLVNMTVVVASGRPSQDKWVKVLANDRTPWHMALSPWKYPRHLIEIREDYIFKQRKDK